MSTGQVKDPALWTVDEIVGIIPNVLASRGGDPR